VQCGGTGPCEKWLYISYTPQDGLFWTVILPAEDVQVDLNAGTATLEADDLHIKDYGNIENALTGYAGPPVPSVVSFKVQWTATGGVNHWNNAAQQFRGEFRNAMAQIEYQIRTVDFDITSAPLAESTTVAAELGLESNGSFY
jgi:hypothetical protein